MKRTLALALTMTSLLAMACSGSAPTSPSRAVAAAPSAAIAIAPSASSALLGASVVNFARCLQTASTSGCFTTRRLAPRDTGGAASPDAPGSLTATAVDTTVTLSWLAPTGTQPAAAYIIEAGTAPGLADLVSFSTNSTATTFTAGGVGAGTYYVRVRAQYSGGVSGASNEAILIVGGGGGGCQAAPGAPTGLFNSVSGSTVTLTWNAPAGGCALSSYVLQAGSSAGASDLANANVGAGTSYIASGVGNGTYYVRVRAVNAFGQSGPSNEAPLTVGGTATPNLSGLWSGSTGPYPLVVSFQHSGTTLTGTLTTPPNYGSFALTQVASSGTTLTFSGTFLINPDGTVLRCPQIGRPGTMTVNTATNTMTGSFTGDNGDCRLETNIFEFHRN